MIKLKWVLGVALLGAALAASIAAAQEGSSNDLSLPGDQAGLGAVVLAEEDITRFATAYHEVEKIRNNYRPLVESAVDPLEKQQFQDDANRAMADIVTTQGFDVDSYNRFARMTHTDAALRKRIRHIADNLVESAPAEPAVPAP